MSHTDWVVSGTTPGDENEVNKREVRECDGYICDVIDTFSFSGNLFIGRILGTTRT